MKLNDKQKKCLKRFYKLFAMTKMCGEVFDTHHDNRTANALVARGLLTKIYHEHNPRYVGYAITPQGLEIAIDMFGLIMDKSWSQDSKTYRDLGFSTDRMRENYVDNHSDELAWSQVSKANKNLFHYRDAIQDSLWWRRN